MKLSSAISSTLFKITKIR